MTDTLPLWFWLPSAVILWSTVAVFAVRDRRGKR
jgi:hypothetical protein